MTSTTRSRDRCVSAITGGRPANVLVPQHQLFDYETSDFMREAGMTVNTNPMSIPGVVIQPPRIRYGNDEMVRSALTHFNDVIILQNPLQRIAPRMGAWNVVGKQFAQPGVLRYWGVVVFDHQARIEDVRQFISRLAGNLGRAGKSSPSPNSRVARSTQSLTSHRHPYV